MANNDKQKFDAEIENAWREGFRADKSSTVMNSLSVLGDINAPAGLKQKLIEIPERPRFALFTLSPVRAASILTPALALILVMVLLPQRKQVEQIAFETQTNQIESVPNHTIEDGSNDEIGAIATDIDDSQDNNILDQDLQDLEEIL